MWQKIKNIYHLTRALLASFYFGFPSKKLTVIGVTGTDGKTTTAHMIYEILKNSGRKVSLISSIFASIGGKTYDTGFHVTTPDPIALQRFIKQMVDYGSEYAILEVTSHGLDQNRVFGIDFTVGVVTNITHEHLDYHKTWQNYAEAKAKLLKNVKFSILNADDRSYKFLLPRASGKIVTYAVKNRADFTPKNFPLKLKIPGEYNIYNVLAATTACKTLGFDDQIIKTALENFKNLTGRMEGIEEGQDFSVIVDFAHTPNALKQALFSLRTIANGRVIAVFGSAGLRDIDKRWMMGEVSAKLADVTIITDEDPRTEDPHKIAAQIAKGCKRAGARQFTVHSSRSVVKAMDRRQRFTVSGYLIVNDRAKAIQFAVNLAKKGDVVGIFGKGHERSMCYGKGEYPWSDQDEARKALKERQQKQRVRQMGQKQ